MPSIIVSLKDGASADKLEAAKKQVTEQGGKVTGETPRTNTFFAEFPADKVHSLETNDHIVVEADGEVKTQ